MQNNPTMRYQLAVYPGLVIFAGWLAMICLQRKSPWGEEFPGVVSPWVATWKQKSLAVLRYIWMVFKFIIPIAVLVLTVAWAYAFTRIYTRPITRIAASRWIYQNVPGPINLHIHTDDGMVIR
jgi:hypothetical protein